MLPVFALVSRGEGWVSLAVGAPGWVTAERGPVRPAWEGATGDGWVQGQAVPSGVLGSSLGA